MDEQEGSQRRSPMEISFPEPAEGDAESRFFGPQQPPGDISLMMLLPKRRFYRTRAFLYTMAALIALGLVGALVYPVVTASGPVDWLEGTWRYEGPEEIDVKHRIEGREISTYIGGVWTMAKPFDIVTTGSESVLIDIGGQKSYVRFDGEDKMTIDDGDASHPYTRVQ